MITTDKITENRVIWNSQDLELLPENGNIYEIIDGDLYMTRAPRWEHQKTSFRIGVAIDLWSKKTGINGEILITPGIVFDDTDNVIPDLVWISQEKLANSVDESGHLTTAPELIVEVLSYGKNDVKRDKETKLKLYSIKGVREYWIADWQNQEVEIYRRGSEALLQADPPKLELVCTLFSADEITSPLFPNFNLKIADIFK